MSEILIQLALCVLAADFLTGLVHWFEDTYGLPTWPIVGPAVIEPNIDHHRRPGLMGAMTSVFERNWQATVLATVAMAALAVCGWWSWQLTLTALLAAVGNEVHLWTHRASSSEWVKFLQDAAVVQTPQQHAKHHREPFDRYYCTITNVTNAVLERLEFWRRLEWLIARWTGVAPKRGTPERDYL